MEIKVGDKIQLPENIILEVEKIWPEIGYFLASNSINNCRIFNFAGINKSYKLITSHQTLPPDFANVDDEISFDDTGYIFIPKKYNLPKRIDGEFLPDYKPKIEQCDCGALKTYGENCSQEHHANYCSSTNNAKT